MSKALEITVWKPHAGKWSECMERMNEFKELALGNGVSGFEIVTGIAGKDVGHIMVIQTFKGLADNGAVNESWETNEAVKAFNKKHAQNVIADLVSHDLYA